MSLYVENTVAWPAKFQTSDLRRPINRQRIETASERWMSNSVDQIIYWTSISWRYRFTFYRELPQHACVCLPLLQLLQLSGFSVEFVSWIDSASLQNSFIDCGIEWFKNDESSIALCTHNAMLSFKQNQNRASLWTLESRKMLIIRLRLIWLRPSIAGLFFNVATLHTQLLILNL